MVIEKKNQKITKDKKAKKSGKKITVKKVKKVKTSKTNKKSAKKAVLAGKRILERTERKIDVRNLPEKPRVAIVSLTSCEGCQFVLLDLGQRFLDFTSQIELVDFRLLEDEEDSGARLDLVLVEGNPITEENVSLLKSVRKRAKTLVALGNCAAMGGIPEIKNYHEAKNTIKHVYKYMHGADNPLIRELDNFVKVDFAFPGCPINGEEFLKYIQELLKGNIPKIADQPVCVECKKKGNRCLLLDNKPCFGPMILGGCDAVCPTARMACQGCRGIRPTGNVIAMRAALKKMMTDEEFENTAEIYGLRDELEERERRQKLV